MPSQVVLGFLSLITKSERFSPSVLRLARTLRVLRIVRSVAQLKVRRGGGALRRTHLGMLPCRIRCVC